MFDESVGTSSALERCSEPFGDGCSVRRVKRAKHHHDSSPSGTSQAERRADRRSLSGTSQAEIVAKIQRVSTTETRAWMENIPPLFSIAVSIPHFLAKVYWLCQSQVKQWADPSLRPKGYEVIIKRLADWLQPLFPELPHDVLVGFLVFTRLDALVKAYCRVLLRAWCQRPPVFFSNDFGTEQIFDSKMHSGIAKKGRGLLRAGDQCVVVFPALVVVEGSNTRSLRALSKRCVLKARPPHGLEDILRDAGPPEELQHLSTKASTTKDPDTDMGWEALLSPQEEEHEFPSKKASSTEDPDTDMKDWDAFLSETEEWLKGFGEQLP